MKVTVFSSQDYDRDFFKRYCPDDISFDFQDANLNEHTAVLATNTASTTSLGGSLQYLTFYGCIFMA
jgi:hypothetical protein